MTCWFISLAKMNAERIEQMVVNSETILKPTNGHFENNVFNNRINMVINLRFIWFFIVIYSECFILDLSLKVRVLLLTVLFNCEFCAMVVVWGVIFELLVKLLFVLKFLGVELIKLLLMLTILLVSVLKLTVLGYCFTWRDSYILKLSQFFSLLKHFGVITVKPMYYFFFVFFNAVHFLLL